VHSLRACCAVAFKLKQVVFWPVAPGQRATV
jgi:hypothetical protein